MTTAVRSPAAAWAATHRTLLALVALAVTLAVAAALTLTVLLGDSGTTTPPVSTWDRSGCGGAMTIVLFRPTC